jgi:hypothetical protein
MATEALPSNAETDVRKSDVCSPPSSDKTNRAWRIEAQRGSPDSDVSSKTTHSILSPMTDGSAGGYSSLSRFMVSAIVRATR